MGKAKKETKGMGWVLRSLFLLAVLSTGAGTIAAGGVYWHFSQGLPKIITVADYRPLGVTRVIGADNTVMGEFYKERRYLVPYDQIPEVVVRAFISAEDDKFFEHEGINFAAILRASIANFKAGQVVQGGSTITQQVAKSLLLTSERSFVRKIKEAILSGRIEKNLEKEQILYLYLNQIYLGHGSYGVQAASRDYFGKDVSQIGLAEAALLAGLPQAPGKYSPHLTPKRAKERQLYVLRRMYENGFIKEDEMKEAAALSLRIHTNHDLNSRYSAYYIEHVRRHIAEKYGDKALYEDGLVATIPTTANLAQTGSKSLKEGLRSVDKRMGYRGPIKNLAEPKEQEEFLYKERDKLIDKHLGYTMFTPEGKMDRTLSIKEGGLQSEVDLVSIDEVYPALVTAVDDKAKIARVLIGVVRAELPLASMKWARPSMDNRPVGPEPALPSKVVSKNDVILVRVLKKADGLVTVGLEQDPVVQGAVFSLDAQTGLVLAMEGGFDYKQSEFNRAIQAARQPGSVFKSILYAAALEKGYTPASIIVDAPIVYEDSESGKWKPANFEEKFYGDTTFRQALIKSRNVPTIKIAQDLQVGNVIEFARRIGMGGELPPDLSISLGSGGVSLVDLTKAFAIFPRLGRKVDPIFITKITDRDGQILEESKPKALPAPKVPDGPVALAEDTVAAVDPQASPSPSVVPISSDITGKMRLALPTYPLADDPDQVIDPRVSFVMTHLMKEVVNYGTGHAAKELERPAAGKTGTTSDYVDAWFLGFTPHVVTGAWVGFDSQKSIGPGETGAKAALPIWLGVMKEAVKAYPNEDFAIPPGIVFASLDPGTGKLAQPNSSKAIKEAFIDGSQPTEVSTGTASVPDSQSNFLKEDIE